MTAAAKGLLVSVSLSLACRLFFRALFFWGLSRGGLLEDAVT